MLAIFDVGGTYLTMGFLRPGRRAEDAGEVQGDGAVPDFVTIMQGLIYHPAFPTPTCRVPVTNSNFAVQPPGSPNADHEGYAAGAAGRRFGMTGRPARSARAHGTSPKRSASRVSAGHCRARAAHHQSETGEDVKTGLRARCWCAGTAVRRVLQVTGEDGAGARPRVGSTRATSARLTTTAQDVPRPLQGHAEGRRRECCRGGNRGCSSVIMPSSSHRSSARPTRNTSRSAAFVELKSGRR